jgi:hypothetical protein
MIVSLSNTQQVISLKLTNTNYLYWQIQMKSYLIGQGIFYFVDGSLSCPPSHVVVADGFSRLNFFFFVTNNRMNLFWVHYFLLFQRMYCILLSFAKPHTVFSVLLSKPSFLCLILVLCNFMDLFKIFVRVMIQSLYTCRRQKYYLMN